MKLEKGRQQDLLEFYRKHFDTNDEKLIARMATHSRVVTVDKGEILFRPEAIAPSTLFLLDGVIKTYVVSPDGTEVTYALFYKPGAAICLRKDMINIPGIWCKALTTTTYIDLVGAGPYELAEKYPDLYKELLRGFDPFYFVMLDKLRATYTLSAKERYLWFLDKYAPVVDKISQVEMAMFLGIKPQSLSRIKSELATEQNDAARKK